MKNADTLKDVEQNDLLQLSAKLLDAVIGSTGVLNIDEMTPEKLKESKLVLGYLNACNSVMKTKIGYFRMVGLDSKIKEAKKRGKNL